MTKIPPDELLEVLEPEPGTGNFVTYAVFAHTLEELYQGAVLQGE